MRETQAEYAHLNLPWILLGDYNVTLSSSEHSRSMDYRSDQINMRAFQEAVTDCSLVDLVFGGVSLYMVESEKWGPNWEKTR